MKAKPQYRKRLEKVVDLLNALAEPELAETNSPPTDPKSKRPRSAPKRPQPRRSR